MRALPLCSAGLGQRILGCPHGFSSHLTAQTPIKGKHKGLAAPSKKPRHLRVARSMEPKCSVHRTSSFPSSPHSQKHLQGPAQVSIQVAVNGPHGCKGNLTIWSRRPAKASVAFLGVQPYASNCQTHFRCALQRKASVDSRLFRFRQSRLWMSSQVRIPTVM